MEKDTPKTNVFSPKRSIKRAGIARRSAPRWSLESEGNKYVWASKMERVGLIRQGLPYSTLEVISKRINTPVKEVLQILSLPQTTYNKKRREKSLLSGRDSETVLLLTELIDFGLDVFNQEEDKFLRWLKKSNVSLGGVTPESLLDSTTGIQEIKNCLSRLEYGNLA